MSRRDLGSMFLGGALALSPSAALAEQSCQDPDPGPGKDPKRGGTDRQIPLGDINPGLVWGTHLEGPAIYDTPFIEALGREQPKVLAVGSALKFGNLHPLSIACERQADGKLFSTWSEVDDIMTVASKTGAAIRGDALVWNDWLPQWIKALAQERPRNWRDQLQSAFDQHFRDVFAHFDALDRNGPSPMRWCGIVNEPFEFWSLNAGKLPWRKGAWLDAFDATPDGAPGYIKKAFECAEKYSRATRPALYLNEANCENDRFGRKLRPAMISLVAGLKQAGCKIDAVGLEAHLLPQWMDDPRRPNWRPFKTFLDQLDALGVKVYITELDVLDCLVTDMTERDRLVADYVYSFVSTALESPATVMVTNWDFSDNYSWLRADGSPDATYRTLDRWANCAAKPACPRPTLYDQNLMPKAARTALARALAGKTRE